MKVHMEAIVGFEHDEVSLVLAALLIGGCAEARIAEWSDKLKENCLRLHTLAALNQDLRAAHKAAAKSVVACQPNTFRYALNRSALRMVRDAAEMVDRAGEYATELEDTREGEHPWVELGTNGRIASIQEGSNAE